MVSCDEIDFKLLKKEDEILLEKYGNSYYFYYKILDERSKFKESEKNIKSFEQIFDEKMCYEFQKRLEVYYGNDKVKMLKAIYYLLSCTDKDIPVKQILSNSEKIPFRFFKFSFDNQIIFKLNSIDYGDKIKLNIQCQKYIDFFYTIYVNIIKNEEITVNKFISNFQSTLESTKLEESFSLLLWASRLSTSPLIKDVKLVDFQTINDIFKITKEDINLSVLENNNDSILFNFKNSNVLAFDSCILIIILI